MGEKQIRDLEDALGATTVFLPATDGEDPFHFVAEAYPGLLAAYESAKSDVAALGMTELGEATLRDCLTLVQHGRRREAENLLFDTCGALRQKSGTWDDMRRMYTASNETTIR